MSQQAAILEAMSKHTSVQLNLLQKLNSNPIKAKFRTNLYNFLIIDPEEVNEDFRENYIIAQGDAEYAGAALRADLQGCIDKDGFWALPTHPGQGTNHNDIARYKGNQSFNVPKRSG
ncbi:hypothetical protein KC345_g6330 [Hortaea werneckii]|nr:hypothetical protein KC345_g6330 [Hortaea werneckii]